MCKATSGSLALALETITRREAFKTYPGLAASCLDFQDALRANIEIYAAGDEIYLEIDDATPTILDMQQAKTLNREEARKLDCLCDPTDDFGQYASSKRKKKRFQELVLEPQAGTFNELISIAGEAVERLSDALGCEAIAIAPLLRTPVLVQDNDYPDAVLAKQRLIDLGLSPTSSDAIEGSALGIAQTIGPLFEITRYNASAPTTALGFAGLDIAMSFCKYGNFHANLAEVDDKTEFLSIARKAGMIEPTLGYCSERFAASSIAGRRIAL